MLRNYFVDTYYGRKLEIAAHHRRRVEPRPGRWAKLAGRARSPDVKDGMLVTGFLGGNSNAHHRRLLARRAGLPRSAAARSREPVGEMNISGNHLELWKRLTAVGNDPYLYSAMRTPTLVFEGVQFAGT